MHSVILLVDDNPVQSEVRRAILSRAALEVAVANSGENALSMLADPVFLANLRLLITDHLMPGMNGPELVGRVRALLPDLPVLVLSGMPDAEDEYRDTPVLFQMKPCPPGELIRLAARLVGDQALRSA